MKLLISLRSEILKTKRTASFYLTFIASAVVPFIFLLDAIFDGISPENRKDAFNVVFREGFMMTAFAIFPIFIVLICTLLPQIEYRNNAWKQVFASPQTKANVFIAKFINIHLLILVFLVANVLFTFIIAAAIHIIDPGVKLLNQPLNGHAILVNVVNAYLTILAISVIQFWIGLRFKNFIIPVAIGISCWFMGSLMALEFHWSMADYFPYSFHVYSIFENRKPQLNTIEWTSAGYTAFFLIAGFIDFKTRKIKS